MYFILDSTAVTNELYTGKMGTAEVIETTTVPMKIKSTKNKYHFFYNFGDEHSLIKTTYEILVFAVGLILMYSLKKQP